MSDPQIVRIDKVDSSILSSKKFLLWVWYANKIPPHIGCSVEGHYYSLKVSGKDSALPASKVISIIYSKQIPFLLLEINKEINIQELDSAFANFMKASQIDATCLTPIARLFPELSNIEQLSHLLDGLKSKNYVEMIYGINLPEDYKGIPAYTTAEIQARLSALEQGMNKKIKVH